MPSKMNAVTSKSDYKHVFMLVHIAAQSEILKFLWTSEEILGKPHWQASGTLRAWCVCFWMTWSRTGIFESYFWTFSFSLQLLRRRAACIPNTSASGSSARPFSLMQTFHATQNAKVTRLYSRILILLTSKEELEAFNPKLKSSELIDVSLLKRTTYSNAFAMMSKSDNRAIG